MSEPRRRGRPPLEEPPARVQVSLHADDYDRASRIARREAVSVPEVLRRGLRVLDEDDTDDG